VRVNLLWNDVLGELCGIPKKARVRGLEIGNPLEHSGGGSSKLDVANKECQEKNLAEHAGHRLTNRGSCAGVPTKAVFNSDNDINDTLSTSEPLNQQGVNVNQEPQFRYMSGVPLAL